MTLDRATLRESLAALAHAQWSGWTTYMFSRSTLNEDGSVTIPADLVNRWRRQMVTDYADLPTEEQASDQVEADKVLALLEEAGR